MFTIDKFMLNRIYIILFFVGIYVSVYGADVDSLDTKARPDTLSLLSIIGEEKNSNPQKQQAKANIPQRVADKSLPVGRIEGHADVTPTGAASYRIPIDVPKGYNGFAPSVDIVYNSQSGNDILGYGWNLSACSMIGRCGKNKYYDNEAAEVILQNSDNLMLDGRRLMLVSGQNLINGSKYRLEDDPSTDIEFKEENGFQCFIVRTKDGIIKKYGASALSRVIVSERILFWFLTSVTDNKGNSIDYSYIKPNGGNECYLEKIAYGNAGSVSIVFEYESRFDGHSSYMVGQVFTMGKRLKSIKVYQGNLCVNKYSLDYEYDGFYSKLSSITKYGKDDKEHYNPTLIEYGSTKNREEYQVQYSSKRNGQMTLFADYKGEGRSSLITYPVKDRYSESDYIWFYSYEEGLGMRTFVKTDSIRLSSGFKNVILADVNGDGRKDVVMVIHAPDGTYRYNYYESDGNDFKYNYRGFNESDFSAMAADFDGDGREEILVKGSQKVYNADGRVIATGGIDDWGKAYVDNYYPNNRFFGDFNGNGKMDILCSNPYGAWVYELQGKKFVRLSSFQTSSIKNTYFTYCGDFNGDGKTDLILQNNNNYDDVFIMFSSGTSFVRKNISGANIRSLVKVGDFNRDGKSDIFHMQVLNDKLVMKVGVFNGTNFTTKVYNTEQLKVQDINKYSVYYDDTMFPLIDIDGDGRSEFCCACYKDACIINSFDDEQGLLVESVTDGFGQGVAFSYDELTDISVCESTNNDISFPMTNVLYPLVVVRQMITNSDNTTSDSFYEYKNPRMHVQGKGFLGFSEISVQENRRRTITVTEYGVYDSYYYPYLSRQKSYTRSGLPISETEFYYEFKYCGYKRFSSNIRMKKEKDYLSGVTAVTNFTTDDYGNVLTMATNYGANMREDHTMTYKTKMDGDLWISVPASTLKTVTTADDSWTEKTVVEYDDKYWPIKKTKFVGDGTKQVSEDSYVYNNNGTVAKIKSLAFGSSEPLVTEYLYRNGTGVEVEDVVDFRSMRTHYDYDGYGFCAQKETPDGILTVYNRDSFGRVVAEKKSDGTVKTSVLSWNTGLSAALYKQVVSESGKPTITTYYDMLGREIRKSEQRFDNSYVCVDKEYDWYSGRLEQESLPFKGNKASAWNTYEYDVYGRLAKLNHYSGKVESYTYSNLNVKKDENGISRTVTYDVRGNVVSVKDPAGTIDYKLRADGNPARIMAPGNVVTTFGYDSYGRKISIKDPSAGLRTYTYGDAGNIASEVMADGKAIVMKYNKFGDILEKTTPEFKSSYTYDSDFRLTAVKSDNGISRTYEYDDFGRIKRQKEMVARSQWLEKTFNYLNGNVQSVDYVCSSGHIGGETFSYSNGVLSEIKFNGKSVWKMDAETDMGMPSAVITGSLRREYTYDSYGHATGRKVVSVEGGNVIQTFSYEFDSMRGNLKWRKDNRYDIKENFAYDDMDRLLSYGGNSMKYDSKGNILSKSDIGAEYVYGISNKPYAVSDINVECNAVLPTCIQSVSYSSFMRPAEIVSDGAKASFIYDDLYNRKKMTVSDVSGNEEYVGYYISDNYESYIYAGKGKSSNKDPKSELYRLYIGGDAYSAPAVYVSANGHDWDLFYICRDYLGSITHITDSTGNLKYEYSYDAWGRMRDPETQDVYAAGMEPELFLGRGYCGHEHLQEFGLINMNARLYDSMLGRFLSPDPYVQEPDMSQNFNRYTYALNNPLKYNDPDGEFFLFTIFNAFTDLVWNVFSRGVNFSHYNWNRTVNSWKIDMGMFRGNIGQILNKWTWGLLNSMVGNLVSEGYNTVGYVDNVTSLDGMLALSGATSGERAFTIGHYSFGPNGYEADWRDHLFVHEYGHYIQSQQWGYFYIPVIAVPSLISAVHFFPGEHRYKWFEVNASKLGALHFDKKYGRGAPGYVEGDENYFDIESFSTNGKASPYINPRKGTKNTDRYFPLTGSKPAYGEHILSTIAMALSLIFIF